MRLILLDSVNAPLELALTFNPLLQCDQMSRISKGLLKNQRHVMEQHALKNVNSCLNTNIYSYLDTSSGTSSNLYLNVVHYFNTSVN